MFEVKAKFKQVMAAKPQSDLLECKEAFESLLRFDAERCSTASLYLRVYIGCRQSTRVTTARSLPQKAPAALEAMHPDHDEPCPASEPHR